MSTTFRRTSTALRIALAETTLYRIDLGYLREDGEDSDWEETDEAADSDEEREDGEESGGPARFTFQRVTSSKPERQSLLTTQIQQIRTPALQITASCSAPGIFQPRTPDGSFVSTSRTNVLEPSGDGSRKQVLEVVKMDSDRINKPPKELDDSLRKHLLWEQQDKSLTFNAKHRRTLHDKDLPNYPDEKVNFYGNNSGEGYHQRGW